MTMISMDCKSNIMTVIRINRPYFGYIKHNFIYSVIAWVSFNKYT